MDKYIEFILIAVWDIIFAWRLYIAIMKHDAKDKAKRALENTWESKD